MVCPKRSRTNFVTVKLKQNGSKECLDKPKVFFEKSERVLTTRSSIVESGLDAMKYCRRTVSSFLNNNGYKIPLARQKGLPGKRQTVNYS